MDFLIASEQACGLGLPVAGTHVMHTSDKQAAAAGVTGEIVRAKTLTIAGHTFAESNGLALPNTRGITLGITLFHDVLLALDFPHDQLRISEGQLPPPNGRDVVPYTTNPEASFRPLQV